MDGEPQQPGALVGSMAAASLMVDAWVEHVQGTNKTTPEIMLGLSLAAEGRTAQERMTIVLATAATAIQRLAGE